MSAARTRVVTGSVDPAFATSIARVRLLGVLNLSTPSLSVGSSPDATAISPADELVPAASYGCRIVASTRPARAPARPRPSCSAAAPLRARRIRRLDRAARSPPDPPARAPADGSGDRRRARGEPHHGPGSRPRDPRRGQCTLAGTAAKDRLRGTKRADVICGLGGADRISGLAGNDTLIGGPGKDLMRGNRGTAGCRRPAARPLRAPGEDPVGWRGRDRSSAGRAVRFGHRGRRAATAYGDEDRSARRAPSPIERRCASRRRDATSSRPRPRLSPCGRAAW